VHGQEYAPPVGDSLATKVFSSAIALLV